jgi:predicted alpha-1,6-mannanase (GH76 family)
MHGPFETKDMRKKYLYVLCSLLFIFACSKNSGDDKDDPKGGDPDLTVAELNLQRSMQMVDKAVSCYFSGDGMAMARFYNPYTATRSEEKGSVWMYTSSIEAVNAILHTLKAFKDNGNSKPYDEHFVHYSELLSKLYDNADYYLGTFTLTSYTQTKQWTVYGVNRGSSKGSAKVEGIENVYDDQMWLVREFLEAYKLTGSDVYLKKAEYLTEYVLDGWDCTLNSNGEEVGGITWGPGYSTKHSCSNGPMVSPLVWLHELYKNKSDMIDHRYIDANDKVTRKIQSEKKSDYYLNFAKKIYQWQKKSLLRSDGVYDDMMGGCTPGNPETETINGVAYRKGATCQDRVGPAITYNSGTMLSGAADLYRATGDNSYLEDGKKLSDASFTYFAKLGTTKTGYYTYDISGFRNWFNGVLMRGYVDIYPSYKNVNVPVNSFQQNLDFAWGNFLHEDFLPVNLLVGWSRDNNNNKVEGMFTFAFAAEYAVLARYELEKEN